MEGVRNLLVTALLILILATAAPCHAVGLPDTIDLDSLANYYEKVSFNHAGHITTIKDCAVCHHHTTGAQTTDTNCGRCHQNSSKTSVTSCRGCHVKEPYSAGSVSAKAQNTQLYHQDKPGLKGAYHLSCLGCHEKMGGPRDCQSCHKRNKKGDALFNSAEFAPRGTEKGKHH